MNMIDLGESSELDLSFPMFPDNKSKYPLMAQFWVEFQFQKSDPDLATISGVNMGMPFHFSVRLLFLLTSVSSSLSWSPVFTAAIKSRVLISPLSK